MKPFDFNVHLPGLRGETDAQILDETRLDGDGLCRAYAEARADAKALHTGINVMVFNEALAHAPEELAGLEALLREDFGERVCMTQLAPLRTEPGGETLARLRAAGVRAIKFHSYVQSIEAEDFSRAVNWAVAAEEAGLAICVDASYGTLGLYRQDNLALVVAILEEVKRAPVIILHSGGLRVLEAMLIALDAPNAWMEASFSLDFYQGSRIRDEIAFAYRKLGPERVLYASDYPYVDFARSLEEFRGFAAAAGFDAAGQERMLSGNALRLLGV